MSTPNLTPPPKAPSRAHLLVFIALIPVALVLLLLVAGGLMLGAGMEASEQRSDVLGQAMEREAMRVAKVAERAAELDSDVVPQDWDFEEAVAEWSDERWGEMIDVIIDMAWNGGELDYVARLDLMEIAENDRFPEEMRETLSFYLEHGGAEASFTNYVVESPSLVVLREAAQQGLCTVEIDLLNDYAPDASISRYNAAAALAVRATVEVDRREYESALASFAGAYSLGFSALGEPQIDVHDYGHWILWMADACLDGVLESFPDLESVEARLGPYFERRRETDQILALFEHEIALESIRYAADWQDGERTSNPIFDGISGLTYSGLSESGQAFIELLGKPYPEIEQEMGDLIWDNDDASESVTDLLWAMWDTYLNHLQSLAMADVFPLALALARHHADHGEYPETIGAESAITLPLDPITGTPMFYMRLDESYVVASPVESSGPTSDRFEYWHSDQ